MTIGDSITAGGTDEVDGLGWPYHLRQNLDAAGEYWWFEKPTRYAVGGYTVADSKAGIDAFLSDKTDVPAYALIWLGANDIGAGYDDLTEEGWKDDYRYIIAALHTKWPSCLIYLGKSYRSGASEAVKLAVLAGWIDDLVAEEAYVLAGPDAMEFLDGRVDLVPDGTHPNHAGMVVIADEWMDVL